MPTPPAAVATVTNHPGSSQTDIANEPQWTRKHQHRVGYLNRSGRVAGLTHDGDYEDDSMVDSEEERRFVGEAEHKRGELLKREKQGDLVNFVDVMKAQTNFREHSPENYPPGWRFVIRTTEDEIKNKQDWPANIKKREKDAEQKKKEDSEKQQNGDSSHAEKQQNGDDDDGPEDEQDPEHKWRRDAGKDTGKHHDAYNSRSSSGDGNENSNGAKSEYQKLREKYTPQEITLLRHIQHEASQTTKFMQNPGTFKSPVAVESKVNDTSIDATDAQTPDNWISRSAHLIRRTGQHPLNAECDLSMLFETGLITPNKLHYVRNHGAVPRLYWEEHVLDICDGTLRLSMDDLVNGKWPSLNIPVFLGCDGNRRGELNLVAKSKGFDWGPGAVGCAYWRGVRVRDVLETAGAQVDSGSGRRWVNFEGADEPSEGKYATCFPLEYIMDPVNDVLLAYEMNDKPLPPDHGFPVRLVVPGYVGGRSVKWLARIWVSEKENDSHYHIWDNRVLPSFITEKDGEFARTMFNHPSTACNEQNLNSVIVKPAQGEELDMVEVLKKDTYRVEGYAYDGNGHEVQRVELSLDGGKTWLYCLRRFPEMPIRHGKKFWTWIHWHIDIDALHFVRAESLTVRCFNVFKNTQPQEGVWNLMGMMNNGWYTVKPTTSPSGKLLFKHPFDQTGNSGGGWMKPSTANQLAAAKNDSGVPSKQFTREEIEKHRSHDDCWLVINDNVYDATSVLDWHPGGSAVLLANAGKLTLDLTTQFESVHDDYAHKKLAECAIGTVTDKAKTYMREQAKAEAEDAAKGSGDDVVLNSKCWKQVTLTKKKQLSTDTFTYTFQFRDKSSSQKLGLGTCQHIQFGVHMLDKMLIRSYTPTRPVVENAEEDGTFDLTVKTYFPDENQPGGAFSNILHEMQIGEQVDVCGPTGEITYLGNGVFNVEGDEQKRKHVSLVVGGSGLTPAYALIKRVIEDAKDPTQIRVIDANKTEADILMRKELNELVEKGKGRLQITHVLSHPEEKEKWEKNGGLSGHVNEDMIKEHLFQPGDDSVVFLCGPPGLIQKAVLPALRDWGYEEDKNCFGF